MVWNIIHNCTVVSSFLLTSLIQKFSGVNVVAILEALHVPESWIEKIKKVPPSGRSFVIAFILCKVSFLTG